MIKIDQVSFHYPIFDDEEPVDVVKNLSLEIHEGEFVAILGHNGSGKSTLSKLLNAQLLPSSGDITILGMNTKDEKELWNIRSHCGVVFQNPDNQMVASIVEEDVAFGPENLGITHPELRNRVEEALQAVQMLEYKDRMVHQLSGGQKQRVAIAGILAMKPSCLILDEPTAMLDPIGRREVLQTIEYLHKQEKKTILLITHFMEEAAMADRIIVLNEGQLALEGSAREVFSQVETMRDLQLDVPQVTQLAHLLNKEGYHLRDDLLTIDELLKALL